jgi:hypothetical protein
MAHDGGASASRMMFVTRAGGDNADRSARVPYRVRVGEALDLGDWFSLRTPSCA